MKWLLAALLVLQAGVIAEPRDSATADVDLGVRISLRPHGANGQAWPLGGPRGEMGYMKSEPLPSPWMNWELFAEDVDPCRTGFQSYTGAEAAAVWAVSFRLLERTAEGAMIDVNVNRRLNPAIDGSPDVMRHRRLELITGEPVTLDALFLDATGKGACGALFVDAEVIRRDPPAIADARLRVDMWRVHTGSDGERVEHMRLAARQGKTVEYDFNPLRFDEAGLAAADGPTTLHVSGNITARARTDGRIDVHVLTMRGIGSTKSAQSSSGRKTLTLSDGETIEIPLPSPDGTNTEPELAALFSGHRTALRIQVRRTS